MGEGFRKSELEFTQQTIKFFETVLRASGDGIVITDMTQNIVVVNDAFCGFFGRHWRDVVETNLFIWLEQLDADAPLRWAELEQRVYRQGGCRDIEFQMSYPKPVEGTEHGVRHLSVNAFPVERVADEEEGVIISIWRDVSTRKRAEEEIKRYAAELERSNGELEQFAYVASHDLQEPLRKIEVFGDRIKSRYGEALDERGQDYVNRMQNAARRMRILINDLLTFSRITTTAQPFVPVNLFEAAQEVISDLEARIKRTGGRVELGDLPTIDADPIQMRQLFQNLIGNGLKFHQPEEPPVVSVQAQLLDRVCQITVKDNGIGFDIKYLDRIFEIFQRLHGRFQYEGTGIGLAICRKIVERHGGSITAKSTPGQGATFIVSLALDQLQGRNVNHEK